MQRVFWRFIPYVSLIFFASLFFSLSFYYARYYHWDNWFLAISANLFSVLLIFFFYEIIKAKAEKELKKELFIYTKTKIDPDVLSIILEITKILFGFQTSKADNKVNLRVVDIDYIENILQNRDLLGFQLFKSRSETINNMTTIIENSFVLNRLNDDQILILIKIINSLKQLESVLSQKSLFEKGKYAEEYTIVEGTELSRYNDRFPRRYLLLKKISENKSVVNDFGDLSIEQANNLEELLYYYRLKANAVKIVAISVKELLGWINKWYEKTGRGLYIG